MMWGKQIQLGGLPQSEEHSKKGFHDETPRDRGLMKIPARSMANSPCMRPQCLDCTLLEPTTMQRQRHVQMVKLVLVLGFGTNQFRDKIKLERGSPLNQSAELSGAAVW